MFRSTPLLILLAVVASLAIVSIAMANTTYDVVQGLMDNTNISPATGPNGLTLTQTHQGCWTYRINPSGVTPWGGAFGSSFGFQASLSTGTYALAPTVYGPGSTGYVRGWGTATAPGFTLSRGFICNSNESATFQLYGSTPGTCVGCCADWQTANYPVMVLVWTAPQAGTASANFLCYCQPNAGSASEFNMALYRGDAFSRWLATADAVGPGNGGAGNGVALSASNVVMNAGDSIVIVNRSANGNLYGARQMNSAISGGINFGQSAPGTITGVISSPSGPVAGATITAGSFATASASDGSYSLSADAGTYTVSANKPGFVSNQVTGISVTSGGTTSGVNISLTPWGTVSGTVSDIYGPISGATVATDTSNSYQLSTTTNSAGYYSMQLPAATYILNASAPRHTAGQTPGVVVTDNTNTTQNITLSSWGKLTGTVSGPSGVIAGATVTDGTVYTATTASDGTYSITMLPGNYSMKAAKPGFNNQTQTAAIFYDTTTTLDFTLPAGVFVSGTVTNTLPPNAPLTGVNVWPTDGSSSAVTDSAGHYSLGLSQGTYPWGKITSLTPNALSTPETWQSGTPPVTYNKWDYEYITINDGGQDIKIPMHVQNKYMSSYDAAIRNLAVDHYVSVVGVAGTTNGTDVAVYPRSVFDILDYTVAGM